MKLHTILAALFAIPIEASPTTTNGLKTRFGPLPEGLGDGLYEGKLSADGKDTEWLYLGPNPSHLQRRGMELIDGPSGPIKPIDGPASGNAYFCSGWKVEAEDAHRVVEGFARMCGTGRRFESVMAFATGTAVAYGCSHANEAVTCSQGAYNASGLLRGLRYACGEGNTGFFSLVQEKVSYGVSHARDYYC
ncbi:hypothetical protein CP532_4697 [Ophiocordyceps camponoti-leonardi (nom. inval.)]|nr:hypothetical protein CP532_4697 [Ophiocordyceps camponoti-leonardi (nom. inval.)]